MHRDKNELELEQSGLFDWIALMDGWMIDGQIRQTDRVDLKGYIMTE